MSKLKNLVFNPIRARLIAVRETHHLTQREQAALMGFGSSTLSNIERGMDKPSDRFIDAMIRLWPKEMIGYNKQEQGK